MSPRLSTPLAFLLALALPTAAAAATFVLTVAGEDGRAFEGRYRLTVEDGQTFTGGLAGVAPRTYRFEGRGLSVELRPAGGSGALHVELRQGDSIVGRGMTSGGGVISLSVAASR